jgi:hypothetical protein
MEIMECKITLFGDKTNALKPETGLGIRYLGDSIPKIPWRPFYRIPWEDISDKTARSCNLIFTLNPDMRVDFDCKDRKICNPKFMDLLHKMKMDGLLTHIVAIYEYGERGKSHGKLHYHGIAKVADRSKFEAELLKMFNKRSQVKHRTLHTKLVRTVADHDRYYKYMKKENQNKVKCLIHF